MLLFAVGLKLDLHHVRHIGPVALATGLGQLAFTIVFGFVLIMLMGKSPIEALYVGVALTFSSTIIIVKLLSDKRELDSLHGRIAVGFLIVQDIAVVLAMMAMSALRTTGDAGALEVAVSLSARVAGAAVVMYALMRWVLPRLAESMARSQELLLFFFIELGSKLDFSTLGEEVWPAAVLSVFVLIGNPLIVMAIMGFMGYRKRTGFLAGLTVAQISEFSIIFVAMGISLGHVGVQALGLTTLVGIVTITMSTYMILFSETIYQRLAPVLSIFERANPFREVAVETDAHPQRHPDIIVFGLGRYGGRLMNQLQGAGMHVLGVDFDPEAVAQLRKRGLSVRFGDGEDPAFLETLPLADAQWVVTTFPQWESNRAFLHALRATSFTGKIAGMARDEAHGRSLDAAGVQRVLNPFDDAADHAARLLAADVWPHCNRS